LPYGIKSKAIKADYTQNNFVLAGLWLEKNGLLSRRVVHQSPFFNVRFNKDPYDLNEGYWIWSIDKNSDWTNDGTIVIWDGFSAKREGGMPLEWLKSNPSYRLLHYIDGKQVNPKDSEKFDIWIFEKVPLNTK
jgi:hypothetical protein